MHIAAAGNTMVPAYLAVVAKSYTVELMNDSSGNLCAMNGEHTFVAATPLELLGLIAMVEVRGAGWRANDDDVDDYFKRFP